jgi:hypothetical protein
LAILYNGNSSSEALMSNSAAYVEGAVDYSTKIPNNVGLASDARVLKALEQWH